MEELRIKCPSCGIILDIRNSKNEAVKRITCPNCKKQLAVTFHEKPQPAQFVDIRMLQLADGSSKTIVRVLTDEHIVTINGEQLAKDDEVVLNTEDKLEIDGKPQFTPAIESKTSPVSASMPPTKSASTPQPKHNGWFLGFALFAVIIVAFVLWQKYSESRHADYPSTPTVDTISVPLHPETAREKQDVSKPQKESKRDDVSRGSQSQTNRPNLVDMSEYDLEKLALKGDAEAQCQLGKRWINRGDSINVVKGIKYLKLAAQNGSQEAQSALRSTFNTLQRSALGGNSTAENILREQR